MKTKLLSLFVALIATTALWASNTLTYTATSKLSETTNDGFSSGLHKNAFNATISSHSFSGGTGTITFSGELTTIGEWAFCGCSGLTSVTIPSSVTKIGEWAFYICSGLTSVTINSNAICSKTYSSSSNIRNIFGSQVKEYIIGNSVTTIGRYAFSGCSGLTSVTIPNSVTTIGDYAFEDCSGLTKTNYTGTIADWCKIKFGNYYANPMYYSHNFYINDVEVKDLVIPQGVDTIGSSAFKGCSGLISVTIPSSVTTIGWGAFYECIGLTSVTIPSSVTTIEDEAFSGCSGLTSVTIPNSVTTIGNWAFYECSDLTKTNYTGTIADWCKIKFGGSSANPMCYSHNFYINDVEVKDLEIPQGVDTIGEYAFYGCTGLTSVMIPSSVTTIGDVAFAYCYGLTSVTIPSSVTTIRDYAFYYCSGLTSVTINSNAICSKTYSSSSNIGNIFGSQVKEYIIGDSVNTIGRSAFSGCSGLTSVTIGNSVTTIGNDAFNGCNGLTSVTIPNSVTTIGSSAFSGCNKITNLIFGSNLTTIGNSAFANCNRIDTMTIYAVEPPAITETTFKNVSRYAFLYVPQSSERKYKTDAYWSYFDIQTISAKNTSISGDEVVVLPSTDNATFTWPQTDDADTYTLEIKKNGELVCILTFNSQGQLINIAFTLARNGERPANYATKTLTGYQFTITGLESGTAYTYAVTAKDASQQVLQTYSGNFTTTGGTATDLLPLPYEGKDGIGSVKFIHNGHLLIERNGILYNAHGARVK